MADRHIRSTCDGCGNRLTVARLRRKARFCSDSCRDAKAERDWRAANPGAQTRCQVCRKEMPFAKLRRRAKFCGTVCAAAHHKAKYHQRNPATQDLPTGTVFQVAEGIVVSSFLLNGFDVYRAATPSAACHLIAERAGVIYRVQIRVGYRNVAGAVVSGKFTKPSANLLAIVARDDWEVSFDPPLKPAPDPPAETDEGGGLARPAARVADP